MGHQMHDRVNVYRGDWEDAGEIAGFTPDGYQVIVDGEEDLGPQDFDAARVETEVPVFFTEAGDRVQEGSWVVAEYVNTPSTEVKRVAGEVTDIETVGGRVRLTLLCPNEPGLGLAERQVWMEEVLDTGNDAE